VAGEWNDLVLVGRVARTHGIRGELVINPDTDFPEERFAAGATVFVQRDGIPVPIAIREAWFHKGRPVVTFEGVDTMNDAEAMRGAELRVPETALQPLPAGTYYRFQLQGCEVITREGQAVGKVREVEGEAGGLRLVVTAGDGEILVPLVEAICVSIDVDARRIVIDPPDGLLELNA
jgi:16S rRNA processing protein RimM